MADEIPDAQTLSAAVVTACEAVPEVSLARQPVTLHEPQQLAQHHPILADIVSRYRFEYAIQAHYTIGTSEQTNCLTVIRMQSAMDAFGPFSLQRTEQAQDLPIPTGAYRLRESLHIWRGVFYVRVCIPAGEPEAEEKAFDLVTEFVKAIPIPQQVPQLLRVLPWRSRQISKPEYHRQAPLGLDFLSNGVLVDYTEGQTTCRLVLMQYPSDEQASAAYEGLRDYLVAAENTVTPVSQLGHDAVQLQSGEHGQCMLMHESGFVAAVMDYHDALFTTALLRTAAMNIRMHLLAGE
ncbi:MAG: DUF6599 family protein [Armatimonadota bacterium]